MEIKLLKQKLVYLAKNVSSYIMGLFYGRTKRNVLLGAWMGMKFADNSRYLFQYLSDRKEEFGLKNVIWATRNEDVDKLLKSMGYKSCMIGTAESRKWHLKSGIHIICNTAFPLEKFDTDIDTRFSFGALKIQLWHGVGFKAVGMTSNDAKSNKRHTILKHISSLKIFSPIKSFGGWTEAKVVATSPQNGIALQKVTGCRADRIVLTGYPRHCECPKLLRSEKEVISKITGMGRSIMYVPTFRSNVNNYSHPLTYRPLVDYLNENNILWIEKPHSADEHYKSTDYGVNHLLLLESSFDINVIYSYASAVISDYSSAVFDSIRMNIPVIMYTPDIEDFKHGDVGFLFDVEDYCSSLISYNQESCLDMLNEVFTDNYFNCQRKETFDKICKDFFVSSKNSISDIWIDLTAEK